VPAFVAKMNQTAAQLGLGQSHFVEPSGVDPGSVSTPQDLIRLGEAALALPVFTNLVGQAKVTLPVSGTLSNFNTVLGRSGIFGIKTGSTAAGGSMLFAAHHTVAGHPVTIIGAVLDVQGLHPLQPALAAALRLVDAAGAAIRVVTVAPAGTPAAALDAPWLSGSRTLTVPAPVRLLGWAGLPVTTTWSLPPPADRLSAGAVAATVTFHAGQQAVAVPLRTSTAIPAPSLKWRLLRR
jgi:D-alanyl-D-alanine carboxypeptidase (penicillin-binding protein 5/6)